MSILVDRHFSQWSLQDMRQISPLELVHKAKEILSSDPELYGNPRQFKMRILFVEQSPQVSAWITSCGLIEVHYGLPDDPTLAYPSKRYVPSIECACQEMEVTLTL